MALPSTSECAIIAPFLIALSLVGIIIYRVYFHPLAHIPGPRLAAATGLYAFYFTIVGGSRLYIQIEKLHQKYGPVIRITPTEVHLSDPENYDKIYCNGTKYYKPREFYGILGLGVSMLTTERNEVHRIRRVALNPFFSRKKVLELESVVQYTVSKLCRRVGDGLQAGQPVDLHHAFHALSVDIISAYAFDRSYNLLDQKDFGEEAFFKTIQESIPQMWVIWMCPIILKVAMALPVWITRRLSKAMGCMVKYMEDIKSQVSDVQAALIAGEKRTSHRTIFHQLLDPNAGEGHVVPSIDDMTDEANSIVGAASETAGNAMVIATYKVLSNKLIHRRLIEELRDRFPDPSKPLDFIALEKLPYLTGVVKEGLRLSYGALSRLPRVTPYPGATFNGYTIPPGSIVGMSSWMMHRNEAIFPSPDTFDPGRWLEPERARRLDSYMVAFSKGSRRCIGMPLAYCEIYVALGTLFRRFDELQVWETSDEDLVYEEYFAPFHPLKARNFHIASQPDKDRGQDIAHHATTNTCEG